MREKIERIARGEIEYELPKLILSEDKIALQVVEGQSLRNCLYIKNDKGRKMKGICYSSNRLLSLESNSFYSAEFSLNYEIHGKNTRVGDIIEGKITIISDCGEVMVPYSIEVTAPYCNTSMGRVANIEDLTNLARMDWVEAKKAFRSQEFEQILLYQEPHIWATYRHLLKNVSISQALEEFMILTNQKEQIEISIDSVNLDFEITNTYMDKLVLRKNQWGYCEIRVSTDVDFIQLDQKYLWADRFIGNIHQVSFVIHPEKLGPGNNFGRIYIKTIYQVIIVDVLCRNKTLSLEHKVSKDKKMREIAYEMTKSYMLFRQERLSTKRYIEEMEHFLSIHPELGTTLEKKLLSVHIAVLSGQMEMASLLLESIGDEVINVKLKAPIYYCTFLYLFTICSKEEGKVKAAVELLRNYYKETKDWKILYLLLQVDEKYTHNRTLKITEIKEQYRTGCRSPILYIEALNVYKDEPYLLRELGQFEIQVIHFGIKQNLLSEELMLQYSYLASKQKHFSFLMYEDLAVLYQTYGHIEILAAICCNLIRRLKKDSRYHDWYRLGVEQQLHITELYEYFMYSLDDKLSEPLPESVLLYFIYNSSLNDKKRAFLYANIIVHKESIPSIYRNYYKRMEVFALKQLEVGNISDHLAILYQEFIHDSSISRQIVEYLPNIMFTHELLCENPNMVAVMIYYRELGEELSISLNEGRAYLQIYSKERDIFLLDAYGNRYVSTAEYNLHPLLKLDMKDCLSMNYQNHPMLLLHLYDYYSKNHILDDNSMELRTQYLMLPKLQEKYYNQCLLEMIEYYHQNQNEAYVNQLLSQINLDFVDDSKRLMFLDYHIRNRNYKKIELMMEEYGWNKVENTTIARLCNEWIETEGYEYDNSLLVDLCYEVFRDDLYNEIILYYLNLHYQGPIESMISLWETLVKHQIDGRIITEKILYHMIFSNHKCNHSIFEYYYQMIGTGILGKSYLNFIAYEYLFRDEVIRESMIHIMMNELEYEENDLYLLSLIRFYGKYDQLSEELVSRISVGIHKLYRRGIILPFFQEYRNKIDLPEELKYHYYIVHKADPGRQVYIHYRLLQEQESETKEYTMERMSSVLHAFHIKSIMLFYREELEYYITEEVNGEIVSRYDGNIKAELGDTSDKSKYNQINYMRLAREINDDESLIDYMEQYIRSDNIMEQCFHPLL